MNDILSRARGRWAAAARDCRVALSRAEDDLDRAKQAAAANTAKVGQQTAALAGALERPDPRTAPGRRDAAADLLRLGSEEDEEERGRAAQPRPVAAVRKRGSRDVFRAAARAGSRSESADSEEFGGVLVDGFDATPRPAERKPAAEAEPESTVDQSLPRSVRERASRRDAEDESAPVVTDRGGW